MTARFSAAAIDRYRVDIIRRVLAVEDLDGVEAGRRPLADAGIAAVEGRMRQRDDRAAPCRTSTTCDDRGAFSRHPRGAALAEEAIERIGLGRGVPGGDQRRRDGRPADRLRAPRATRAGAGCRWARQSAPAGRRFPSRARSAARAGAARNAARSGVRGIDEVAEHVDVPSVLDGRDLDAVDERQAEAPRPPACRTRGRRSCRDR